MKLEERKLARRQQDEINKKNKAQRDRDEENAEMMAAKSMNTSMSGSPFKAGGVQFSQAGSSPTKSKVGSPYGRSRAGDAASQSETESRMTGATAFGKSPMTDIFNLFRGGGQIAELQKEFGKTSGLTAGNKDFKKL